MNQFPKKITIQVIPHSLQRYNTCGDYVVNKDEATITVSEMTDSRYSMAIALHELYEMIVVLSEGTSLEAIDKFDEAFEELRIRDGNLIGNQEPGDMVSAPYHKAHIGASNVEKLLIGQLKLNFDEYENAINML